MASETDNLSEFLRRNYGVKKMTGVFSIKTNWWAKEKKEVQRRAMEIAMERSVENQAQELDIPMKQLAIAKSNAIKKIIIAMMNEKLTTNEMLHLVKALRTEMALPNNYTKAEVTAEVRHELNQEDIDLINKFIDETGWAY